MGRTLAGNTAKPKTTKLAQLLGSTSANTVDVTTKSYTSLGGITPYAVNNNVRKRNTCEEQQNNPGSYSMVLQDDAAAYNLLSAYTSNSDWRIWIMDDDLAVLDVIQAQPATMGMTSHALRIYNGKIYWFGVDGTKFRTIVYDIATKVYTTYDQNHGLGNQPDMAVFNWPVNGKFYIYWKSGGSPYMAGVRTFDIATTAYASPFSDFSGSLTTWPSSFYGFHVKADGTAVSVVSYNGNANQYGVWTFTASAATRNPSPYGANGQAYWGRTGEYPLWTTLGSIVVTKDCLINVSPPSASNGSTYYTFVTHLQGGDANVIGQEMTGTSPNTYPVQGLERYIGKPGTQLVSLNHNSVQGFYNAVRTGSTLSFSYVRQSTGSHVQCQLANCDVASSFTGPDTGGAYMSNITIRTATGRTASWSFHAQVSGVNDVRYGTSEARETAFVTRKGKLFAIGCKSSSQTTAYAVMTQIPFICPSQQTTYNVSVIGGGGSSVTTSPVHGTGSSFAGIAAAGGQNRTGGRSGTQVITSGPLKGTGGEGYFDEKYGAGEDATGSGQYGGGSGYLATGTITIPAGEVVPYVAGLPPQYGGQGAVVLSEV